MTGATSIIPFLVLLTSSSVVGGDNEMLADDTDLNTRLSIPTLISGSHLNGMIECNCYQHGRYQPESDLPALPIFCGNNCDLWTSTLHETSYDVASLHADITGDARYELPVPAWDSAIAMPTSSSFFAMQPTSDTRRENVSECMKNCIDPKSLSKKPKKSNTDTRGFTPLKWQHDIPRPLIRQLYFELTRDWPLLEEKAGRQWDISISRYLDHRPTIVQGLFASDQKAWQEALDWCKAESMIARSMAYSRSTQRKRQNRLIKVNWLAGQILSFEKDRIFERLAKYWNNVALTAIQGRITSYVKAHGKIHSPEPLLDKDEAVFRKAADLIFLPSDRPRLALRHPDAGANDSLHQPSTQYGVMDEHGRPIHLPYQPTQKRPSARRYHTPHSWLDTMSISEIDLIHAAVAKHYAQNIKAQKRLSLLLSVNEYLERNPGHLYLIKAGSDYVAWQVAKDTSKQPYYMQHPDQYHPSSR